MAVFYPSLFELIDPSDDDSFNCVWSTKDKASNEWRICRNPILLEESRKRDGLIRDIRAIMLDNKSKATPTSKDTRYAEYTILLSKLDLLSNLMLCKGAHRSSNAKNLSATWTESLRHFKTEVDRDEINIIRRRLGLSLGERLTCYEQSHGVTCRNGIEASKRERAREILRNLAGTQATPASTCSAIKELTSFLLCSEHLDKVGPKSKEWSDTFDSLEKTFGGNQNYKIMEYSCGSFAKISQARAQGDEDAPRMSHPRVTRRTTRELASGLSTPEPAPILFEPFKALTYKEISKKITALISRDLLLVSECDSGYIYACRRDSSDKVKIGCSNDAKRRINQLEKDCNQKVEVLVNEYMPHFRKAEKLIHLILHKERRREKLVNGHCNGGKGCLSIHGEWFETSLQQVNDIIQLVKSFTECSPYDEDRHLKEAWKLHFQEAEIMSMFVPWKDIIYSIVLKEGDKIKTKLDDIVEDSSPYSTPPTMSAARALKPEPRVKQEDEQSIWA